MDRPEFPSVNPLTIINRIHALPSAGKQVALKSRPICASCRRDAAPLGVLLYPGVVTCTDPLCSYIPYGKVCEIFPTPYGRAMRRTTLTIFCESIELPSGRILVQREPIIERAEILADAYKRLIDWQRAIDTWDCYENPDDYDEGIVNIIPPRLLEDVLAIRATEMPEPISPIANMPEDLQLTLRRVLVRGEEALDVPF